MKNLFLSVIPALLLGIYACSPVNSKEKKQARTQEKPVAKVTQKTSKYPVLYQTLKTKDSLLFNLAFNKCDSANLGKLVHEDFEFYHDKSGITTSKTSFLSSVKNWCNSSDEPSRKLKEGSMEVFPLYDGKKMYGVVQKGVHQFHISTRDKKRKLTSTAKFTHLWIKEGDQWQLKRVLSYDHR